MNLRNLRRRRTADPDRSRGQALAEFAIVGLILILIFSTVLDLGRVFYAEITLQNAARAGAMQAAVTPDSFSPSGTCDTDAHQSANQVGCAVLYESRDSAVTVQGSQITVTCTDGGGASQPCPSSPQLGWRSTVAVTGTFTLLTPILQPIFGGSTLHLGASVGADQQYLPPASTALPSGAATATAPPTSSAPPTATASASATPSPSPSPVPCASGQAPVPDLMHSNDGSAETVSQARAEWVIPGFSANNFYPSNGSNSKVVLGQYSDPGMSTPLVPGACVLLSTVVYVSHS